jgi:predicted ATPase
MLTKHQIDRFNSCHSLHFSLSPITLFMGHNNTGKSSILRHIYYKRNAEHVLYLNSRRAIIPNYYYLKDPITFLAGINGQYIYPFFIALKKSVPNFEATLSKTLSDLNLVQSISLKQSTTKPNKYKIIAKTFDGFKVEVNKLGTSVNSILQLLILLEFVSHDTTLALDNPDAGLDPQLQVALADILIDYYKTKNLQFLVETNSINFLTRFRRRIAEGSYYNTKFKVYNVYLDNNYKTKLTTALVDEEGTISNWDDILGDSSTAIEIEDLDAILQANILKQLESTKKPE